MSNISDNSNMLLSNEITSDIRNKNMQQFYSELCNNTNLGDMNISRNINYNVSNISCNSDDDAAVAPDLVKTLFFYYAPIVICTGIIGNILSIIVFCTTKLRKLSSSYYLAALAISDTYFLLLLSVSWLERIDILNTATNDICCQFYQHSIYFASFCSVWFVVALTVERFIVVLYPLKRQTVCTPRRAKIVLFVLTLVGCLNSIPYGVVAKSIFMNNKLACLINQESMNTMKILNYWDSIIVLAVPFILIATLNTWTGYTVWKFAAERRLMTMQNRRNDTLTNTSITSNNSTEVTTLTNRNSKGQNSNSSQQSEPNYSSRHYPGCMMRKQSAKRKTSDASQELKVTKMLMVVSTVFVCLNLPSSVMRIKAYLEEDQKSSEAASMTLLLQHIFELPYITNFGINFVLYCVCGQNFRKEVLNMFRRRSHARHTPSQLIVCRPSESSDPPSRRQQMMSCWYEIREI